MSEFKVAVIEGSNGIDLYRNKDCVAKSRFSYTSEQAKRIGDRQLERYMKMAETLGDDFPIENHISPYCQSKDV
ncbi:hypothetical protein ACG59Z_01085 [Acinetobacter sp. ABJ_C1_1]|uniref:hypothetical protein n=1 Tax=Acinetobacter sp. ABJ_C1_1 TaxID=3378321 RepID=UPI0037DDA0E8